MLHYMAGIHILFFTDPWSSEGSIQESVLSESINF
jgi:hypothetical protein